MPGPSGLFPNIIKVATAPSSNYITGGPNDKIYIAINPDISYGETGTTGFWNGVTPPSGGYVVYINNGTTSPTIFGFADDTSLINYANKTFVVSYTTISEALTAFAMKDGYICVNYDYPYFPTNGLLLNYDAWYSASYTKSNSSFYDTSGNGVTASIVNGCSFLDNGILLNGSNQVITIQSSLNGFSGSDLTFSIYFSFRTIINNAGLASKGNAASTGFGLWTNTGGDLFFTHQGSSTLIVSGLIADVRYLLTMRYTVSSTLMDFFIDGNLITNKAGINITDTSALAIGFYNSNYSNSRIYSIKKYNVFLSDTIISNMSTNFFDLYGVLP